METICTYLLSMMIVGATEIKPGIMMIQHLDYKTNEVIETVNVYRRLRSMLGRWKELISN